MRSRICSMGTKRAATYFAAEINRSEHHARYICMFSLFGDLQPTVFLVFFFSCFFVRAYSNAPVTKQHVTILYIRVRNFENV